MKLGGKKNPFTRHGSLDWTRLLMVLAAAAAFVVVWTLTSSGVGGNGHRSTPSNDAAASPQAPSIAHAVTPQPKGASVRPHMADLTGYTPPSTISDTCAKDVTAPLAKWLYSLPQGSAARPTVVAFKPNGCYEVNGSLFLRGFRYFVFAGNGSVFKQTSVANGAENNVQGPNRPAYCGSNAYSNSSATDFLSWMHTIDIMFFVEGGCDISFENMTIRGQNNGTGGGVRMQDTFITFAGTQYGLVDGVNMSGPYGDYVDAQALHEAPGPLEYRYTATNITVENGTFSGSGRQGIAVVLAGKVNVENNTFQSAAATMFDVEWDSTGGLQTDINIANNTIAGQHYAYLISAQTGARVQRLAFVDNLLAGGAQMRVTILPAVGSSDVTISGNTATGAPTWPGRASITISNVSRSIVSGNEAPVGLWKPGETGGGPFANIDGGYIANNTLVPVEILDQMAPGLVVKWNGTECGNVTNSGMHLDPTCGTLPTVVPPAIAALPEN